MWSQNRPRQSKRWSAWSLPKERSEFDCIPAISVFWSLHSKPHGAQSWATKTKVQHLCCPRLRSVPRGYRDQRRRPVQRERRREKDQRSTPFVSNGEVHGPVRFHSKSEAWDSCPWISHSSTRAGGDARSNPCPHARVNVRTPGPPSLTNINSVVRSRELSQNLNLLRAFSNYLVLFFVRGNHLYYFSHFATF